MFKTLKQWFADLVFPKKCVVCERLGEYLCARCFKPAALAGSQTCPRCNRLSRAGRYCARCRKRGPLVGILACGYFKSSSIKRLVHEFKYGGVFDIAEMMSDLMCEMVGSSGVVFDLVAFVPQSRKRRIWRGYNQSEILARHISEKTGRPLFLELKKIKETETQVGLSKKKRERNLKYAFSVTHPRGLQAKRILLVDDVKTTGATLSAVAEELKTAGARSVHAIVFAKE